MEHSTGSCVLMNFQQGLFLSSSLRKRSLVVTKSAKRGSTLSSSAAPVALTALSFSGVSRAATCSAASGLPRHLLLRAPPVGSSAAGPGPSPLLVLLGFEALVVTSLEVLGVLVVAGHLARSDGRFRGQADDTLPQKDVLALHGCPQEHQLLRKAPLKPLLLDWALGIGEVGQEDVCILQPQHRSCKRLTQSTAL